ncbi:MAG TPA: hypothetical protein VLA47_04950 [Nitrospira sp.]|nr:hypothetical protein [Nitrospira sp.]
MSLILRLSRFLATPVALSPRLAQIERGKSSDQSPQRLPAIAWLITAGLCLSLVGSPAWGRIEVENEPEKGGTIVAAGFGYQIGDLSAITVRVYDAMSGEVLSDELYELSVDEGNSTGLNSSQQRIFAGGVGLGATDLSNFMLRVYDARTGAFQWEGQLNLTPRGGSGAGQLVSTVVPRHAMVTRIHAAEPSIHQPVFVLRALDAATGGLVWEDEFSTDGIGIGRGQHLVIRPIGLDRTSMEAFNTFDFRIRMWDRNRQVILWEDRISHQEVEEEFHEAADDQAHMLPPWPRQPQPSAAPEAS